MSIATKISATGVESPKPPKEIGKIPEWGKWDNVLEALSGKLGQRYGFITPMRAPTPDWSSNLYARIRDGRHAIIVHGKILFLGDQYFNEHRWVSVEMPTRDASVIFVRETEKSYASKVSTYARGEARVWANESSTLNVDIDPIEESLLQLRTLIQLPLPHDRWSVWRECWRGTLREMENLPDIIEPFMLSVGRLTNRVRPRITFQKFEKGVWRPIVDPRINPSLLVARVAPPGSLAVAPPMVMSATYRTPSYTP